jgi:predicted Zn-dependent peptidase
MKDPIELPGLAHFCEHMLFLGTKKVILLQNNVHIKHNKITYIIQAYIFAYKITTSNISKCR